MKTGARGGLRGATPAAAVFIPIVARKRECSCIQLACILLRVENRCEYSTQKQGMSIIMKIVRIIEPGASCVMRRAILTLALA